MAGNRSAEAPTATLRRLMGGMCASSGGFFIALIAKPVDMARVRLLP